MKANYNSSLNSTYFRARDLRERRERERERKKEREGERERIIIVLWNKKHINAFLHN
jgi:hypothetical protein